MTALNRQRDEKASREHGQCRFCWWGTGIFIPWTFTNQDEPVGCSRPQRSLFQRTARIRPYPALNYSNISTALSSSLYKPHTKSVLQEHCCSWERPALLPLPDLLHDLGIKKCICTQEPSWERTSKRDFPYFKYLISQCEQCPFQRRIPGWMFLLFLHRNPRILIPVSGTQRTHFRTHPAILLWPRQCIFSS